MYRYRGAWWRSCFMLQTAENTVLDRSTPMNNYTACGLQKWPAPKYNFTVEVVHYPSYSIAWVLNNWQVRHPCPQ